MSPMLDLKRRLQSLNCRVEDGELWVLFWAFFVSFISFLMFLKDVVFMSSALLQLVYSSASVSQSSRPIPVYSEDFEHERLHGNSYQSHTSAGAIRCDKLKLDKQVHDDTLHRANDLFCRVNMG